jgi:hypothetical protein
MKNTHLFAAALMPAVLSCGCAGMSNTDRGVLGGGAIGAGTGALIGSATGHTGAGALIGGGVGAVTGGLIGNAADEREKKTQEQIAAAQARQQLGMADIVQMTQQHISDPVIINQIRSSYSVYQLSAQDTMWLKQNGVSDTVITEMMATASRYPRRVYTDAPVYADPPVVVVEPPPPPVGVGIGFRVGH